MGVLGVGFFWVSLISDVRSSQITMPRTMTTQHSDSCVAHYKRQRAEDSADSEATAYDIEVVWPTITSTIDLFGLGSGEEFGFCSEVNVVHARETDLYEQLCEMARCRSSICKCGQHFHVPAYEPGNGEPCQSSITIAPKAHIALQGLIN
jgi:hypothetical protein